MIFASDKHSSVASESSGLSQRKEPEVANWLEKGAGVSGAAGRLPY